MNCSSFCSVGFRGGVGSYVVRVEVYFVVVFIVFLGRGGDF